jgi:serine/threonine protein phosphatase PrpC
MRVHVGYALDNRNRGEDAVLISEEEPSLFAVFDGHITNSISEFARDNFLNYFRDELKNTRSQTNCNDEELMAMVLDRAFEQCNEAARKCSLRGGATASVLCLFNGYAYCANAGDSRIVLSKDGVGVALSIDHMADSPDEKKRICSAGGQVEVKQICTSTGDTCVEVSRGFGNFNCPGFSSAPYRAPRVDLAAPDSQFFIVASDGLWDKVSDEYAVEHVTELLARMPPVTATQCAQSLVDLALSRSSNDDITVIVILNSQYGLHANLPPADPEDAPFSPEVKKVKRKRPRNVQGVSRHKSLQPSPNKVGRSLFQDTDY